MPYTCARTFLRIMGNAMPSKTDTVRLSLAIGACLVLLACRPSGESTENADAGEAAARGAASVDGEFVGRRAEHADQRDFLRRGVGDLGGDTGQAFIEAARPGQSLSALCARYGVSRAGYYVWQQHQPSVHSEQDRKLLSPIQAVYAASEGTYGSPRIYGVLQQAGIAVSRKRVARLMREAGLRARAAGLYHANPGTHAFFTSVPNRIRKLKISAVDQVWVGDITYLMVGSVYRYLAVVMDKCSRRVVGWSYGPRKDVKLTLGALNRAVQGRLSARRIVFHTDRGIEYSAGAFQERIRELGFTQSMNRPGKMTDNAFIESFFHSMKTDIYHGHRYQSDDEIRAALKSYVPFYNSARLHSSLDYVPPATYERQARRTGCQ